MRHDWQCGGATEDGMASGERGTSNSLLRVAAVLLIGIGFSGCSTVPTWADPTSWLGPDVSGEAQADGGQYPDLSNMPDRPAPASTPDERAQVASSLAAARNNAEYSAETLRGGTEAAAPPPEPAASAAQLARAEERSAAAEPPSEGETPSPPQPEAAPVTQVATAAEPPAAPAYSGEPAVPAVPADSAGFSDALPGMQPSVPADARLGFQPSKAPPLDASVAQFVPQPIIARYAQTASVSGALAAPAVSARPAALKAPRGMRRASVGMTEDDVGGPESMSGDVVANLAALQSPAVAVASVYASPYGLPPVAVVQFPNDTIALDSAGQEQVRAAIEAYRSRGGHGYIRVVGHSSSRTRNMSVARQMELNFRKSQQRATSVARALIRAGIPADKVLVNAVGDSQPVYYESMPKGEEGNRRAEIYLQG